MNPPICRHRSETADENGRYACGHPGLMTAKGVSGEDCRACHSLGIYCDREPLPHHLRRGTVRQPVVQPCKYRGAVIDAIPCPTCTGSVRVKLYQCKVFSCCFLVKPNVAVLGIQPGVCDGCNSREV